MDLEGIMPSEIKDKCCMLPLVQSGKKKKKEYKKTETDSQIQQTSG